MKCHSRNISLIFFIICVGLIFNACYKDGALEENPFEVNTFNQDTVNLELIDIEPTSIAGLYQNIFGPTCANSGCHDGTFEPDFRTMESSYHSMVYKAPIKNDGSLTYRVDPGNPNQSALLQRIIGDITPLMPIEIEPDSDWIENSETYIQNIRDWISDGARDLSGNLPDINIVHPTIMGVVAEYNDTTILRDGGYGPFLIPDSLDNVTFYFSFDPINNPEAFELNEFMLGIEESGFQSQYSDIMEVMDSPKVDYGLFGKSVLYTHKIEINLDSIGMSSQHIFMRIKVQDGSNTITEIPTDDAFYNVKEYLSFIRSN